MSEPWVPTVNDLRVKLCYICREEERHDDPEDPSRPWTHPCNCTLIAHESCLLQWIQTSQQDQARAANALKCPQCGARYELESENPWILRILDAGNRALSVVGKLVTVSTFSAIVWAVGTGVYIICTGYGAYAVQKFIGKDMFNILLTDDPINWPWHAFINLPLIPISLILSRMPIGAKVLPIVPLLLVWPSSSAATSRSTNAAWRRSASQTSVQKAWRLNQVVRVRWPPSPALVGLFVFPIIRAVYKMYRAKLTNWVMNSSPTPRSPGDRRRVGGGRARFRLRFGVGGLGVAGQQAQPGNAAAAGAGADAAAEARPDAGAAVEHTIHITGTSLGRLVGGALIVPDISNIMGSLLYRLSAYSCLLRRFLAIKPKGALTTPVERWENLDTWNMGPLRQFWLGFRLALDQWWNGSNAWLEEDPVWWRNSIGLGMFVVAKDCVHLFHLWLAKRELQSRRVKNKTFEGVDIRELDVVPPQSS